MRRFHTHTQRHWRTASLLAIAGSISALALADVPQHLSATVDGKRFESDDDSITYLLPRKSVLNLIAKTKGSSAYPPPKTPIDQLSIVCNHFEAKPVKFAFPSAGSPSCEVRFKKGLSKEMFGDPQAEYKLADGNNQLEITSVQGKVIEGKFSFELIEVKTKARMTISSGIFKAEDRQL
jgi:hypothetical protein